MGPVASALRSSAVRSLYGVGLARAIAGSVLGFLIVYVVLHQWLLEACCVSFALDETRGHVPFWFFYTAGMLVFLALFDRAGPVF